MQGRYNSNDNGTKNSKKEVGRPKARWTDQVTMVIQILRKITAILSHDRRQISNSLTRVYRMPPRANAVMTGNLNHHRTRWWKETNLIFPEVQISG